MVNSASALSEVLPKMQEAALRILSRQPRSSPSKASVKEEDSTVRVEKNSGRSCHEVGR